MFVATESKPKLWTLEEVHSLPDDGNKYELIHGELYVTPAPTDPHETILARLSRMLEPYVARHNLGFIYRPRAVFRIQKKVEVEPDLMVRQPHPGPKRSWETAPRPILIVEVRSPTTWRRDIGVKRSLYRDEAGIPSYWMVDGEAGAITVVRPGHADEIVTDRLVWHPDGATEPLELEVRSVIG